MSDPKCDIGVIGLGNMGRNLVLNLADKGFTVGVYNRTTEKTDEFMSHEAGGRSIQAGRTLREFVDLLEPPRSVLLIVSAGKAVDAVIDELTPLLGESDLIIDGGNSHFSDTDWRAAKVEKLDLGYLGMGISGGEEGARHGPSLMPGGHKQAYDRVHYILEKAAAQVDGEPCVTFLGSGSAGHYVKMVHNGIEYAFMEMIAETYDLLHRGAGLGPEQLAPIYRGWSQGELGSYLLEITARIFEVKDPQSDHFLVDMILDQAKQKGTGKWTSQDAMELQEPTPTIDGAVSMRNLSVHGQLRQQLEERLGRSEPVQIEPERLSSLLESALYTGLILTFSQGMALLAGASRKYEYGLKLEEVCRIWRGGCIIRAKLLERLRLAYQDRPDLPCLLLDHELGEQVRSGAPALREVVSLAAASGIPAPGLMASLAYLDAMRSEHLPTNLVQAQRDFFGGHTFERVDREGVFHHQWQQSRGSV
ncbi:NADP-dependent phosphogluconate dehydrogenase [Desulfoferula mesophila]|uniref:6-phosphogluconate dehydrogenase, decarboxylating n=1 Tax=Desulfoferula mesophila TaxID=3058419 RepID=A0AAU9EZI0_9BACT|nr:6-phosphogluconate dehydrogenase, decarboxylating [Desulfoferula mesophilus]